jgi:hypothetical protein
MDYAAGYLEQAAAAYLQALKYRNGNEQQLLEEQQEMTSRAPQSNERG